MIKNIYSLVFTIVCAGLFVTSCKKWDDHNAVTDAMAGKDLFQLITEREELSKFADLLTKSGYDEVIASSRTYTVFAPSNTALASIDPSIIADSARLRSFVANHIANQLYQTTSSPAQRRILMLSGKYNNLQNNMLEDANITVADKYAKNGFFHIIDKVVPALPNTWESMETSALVPGKQKNFLLSLYRNVFSPSTAVQIGVDPVTGLPVYQPGTDSIHTNLFWSNVYDLRDERKQFTFFILTDNAWDTEVNKYKPFFATGNADSTTRLASYEVVKDFVIDTVYPSGTLPDSVVSKFNTKVGIEKSEVVQTIKTSNGIVYLMNKVDVRPKDKFKQVVIQGESFDFTRVERDGNIWFRDKLNQLTGQQFKDVVVYDHNVAQFYLGYRLNNIPAIKYKAYWVALNDNINGNAANFTQMLGLGTPTAVASGITVTAGSPLLSYITVRPNEYQEVYLGEFTLGSFRPTLDIFLTSANNATNDFLNTMTLDYVRFEPVL